MLLEKIAWPGLASFRRSLRHRWHRSQTVSLPSSCHYCTAALHLRNLLLSKPKVCPGGAGGYLQVQWLLSHSVCFASPLQALITVSRTTVHSYQLAALLVAILLQLQPSPSRYSKAYFLFAVYFLQKSCTYFPCETCVLLQLEPVSVFAAQSPTDDKMRQAQSIKGVQWVIVGSILIGILWAV